MSSTANNLLLVFVVGITKSVTKFRASVLETFKCGFQSSHLIVVVSKVSLLRPDLPKVRSLPESN